ncbi:MAG: UbiD family decarboxylase, partial [Gammaproteobacteria bacterium]
MSKDGSIDPSLSRRELLVGGSALAGLSAVAVKSEALARPGASATPPSWPYDGLRDYIAALEARGLVMRFDQVDQDAYEATALMYRAIDVYGTYDAPALVFENLKIDGRWIKGPMIANHQGHWDTEALTFGLDPIARDGKGTYRKAMAYLGGILEQGRGSWPLLDPVEVDAKDAPCKEIVLTGDDIDLTQFPFIQSNPADGGRYVNTGSVFTVDQELGKNFGTYRCQIKGPRKLGVNPEPGQTGWRHLMAMRERGEKVAKIAIALGQDPITWTVSGSVVAPRRGERVDELALAGGLRRKPLEVVRSEINPDILVPAHCEMVIEGEVPLDEPMLPEGPFGEMYGYLGLRKEENFWMRVTAVTHRPNPWFLNSFTGATRGFVTSPLEAGAMFRLRRAITNIVAMHSPVEAVGWTIISIDKTAVGQGLEAGNLVANVVGIAKVVVVVDKDIDVLDRVEVMHTISSRWQPHPAANIIEEVRGMPLDPSSPNRPMTSKIVIDATRQWPEEGGPTVYPRRNRSL